MKPGYYWYRSTAEHDPASGGDWVIVFVDDAGAIEVADTSVRQEEMRGEFYGPIEPPTPHGGGSGGSH
jgi:hypothetical protein